MITFVPALPDRLMAGQLILVQFVLVRIQLGQRKESYLERVAFLFMVSAGHHFVTQRCTEATQSPQSFFSE